jgi:hypothetical protein
MSAPPAQFSHQVTRLQFPKDVHFGDDISIWIAKVGDVALGNMYLRVDWPVASTVDDSAGTRMIDFVELRYENDLLERHYGESLEIMNDLSVTAGKQSVLTTLIGKGLTSNLASYYIRMPFRLNLPLCALNKAPVFRVKFRPSKEFSTLNWTATIKVNLFVDYVYVTKAERDYFKTAKIDYLTHTIQRLQFTVNANVATSTFLTEFTRPVKELYWVIQTDGASSYDFTNQGAEQIVSLRLQFNGIDVILPEIGTPLFLRTIQGLESHTRVPDRKFYMYPFALDPEHPTQPTGSVNMSALTRQLHTLKLSPSASSRQIRVYAVTHNVVRIADGAATSLFDNVQEGGTVTNQIQSPPVPSPAPPPVSATGGTVTTYSSGGTTYRVHKFTSSGTFTVTSGGSVDVLCVGGGGAGINNPYAAEGGGGGGGYVVTSTVIVSNGSIPVTIGTGGYSTVVAVPYPGTPSPATIVNGTSSSFGAFVTALPGGNASTSFAGANTTTGGTSQSGTPTSYLYMGGAGAGTLFGPITSGVYVNGGDGIQSSISGTPTYYGGGGGGSYLSLGGTGGLGGGGNGGAYYVNGTNGTPNTGGGAGGSASYGTEPPLIGGSGIVIARYVI